MLVSEAEAKESAIIATPSLATTDAIKVIKNCFLNGFVIRGS